MFLHVAVILSTGGVGQAPPDRHPLGRHPPESTPPGQTPPAADGTHPTGMYSCLEK